MNASSVSHEIVRSVEIDENNSRWDIYECRQTFGSSKYRLTGEQSNTYTIIYSEVRATTKSTRRNWIGAFVWNRIESLSQNGSLWGKHGFSDNWFGGSLQNNCTNCYVINDIVAYSTLYVFTSVTGNTTHKGRRGSRNRECTNDN